MNYCPRNYHVSDQQVRTNTTHAVVSTHAHLHGKIESGFINGSVFSEWLKIHFIPQSRASPTNPQLLIIDNHSAHFDAAASAIAERNGVFILTLPANATHFAQPLDVRGFNRNARVCRECRHDICAAVAYQ
jgi:hypothetical protein